jgi:cell division transport system permease protein
MAFAAREEHMAPEEPTTGPSALSFGLAEVWAQLPTTRRSTPWENISGMTRTVFTGIARAPLGFCLALLSITLTLTVCAVFIVLAANLDNWLLQARANVELSFFLKPGTTENQAKGLLALVREDPAVASVSFVSSDQAIERFRLSTPEAEDLLQGLGEANPLPSSIEVQLRPESATRSSFKRLISEFGKHPVVDKSRFSEATVGALGTLLSRLRRIGSGAGSLLLGLCGVLIFNVIRLLVQLHTTELEVQRLVGESVWRMRFPYLVEGALLGCLGALLAVITTAFMTETLGWQLGGVEVQWLASHFESLSFTDALTLMLGGTLVGLGSSYLAVRKLAYD